MTKKILVVDDEIETTDCLKSLFGERDFEVITAHNGEEAVFKAQKERPDLIILDVMMPSSDGCIICGRIKDDNRLHSIPIIMLTAMYSMEDYSRGLESGADLYMTKPYSAEDLLKKVNSLV
ncbi:MAG: response regulator [Candidatus Omnitrophica bacterium]|nr:response regulator [Candidatus Omnitrophota bacterium]